MVEEVARVGAYGEVGRSIRALSFDTKYVSCGMGICGDGYPGCLFGGLQFWARYLAILSCIHFSVVLHVCYTACWSLGFTITCHSSLLTRSDPYTFSRN